MEKEFQKLAIVSPLRSWSRANWQQRPETHLLTLQRSRMLWRMRGKLWRRCMQRIRFKEGRRVAEFQEVAFSDSPIDRHRR